MKLQLLVTLAAISFSSTIQASTWVKIATGPDTVLSIDIASVRTHNGMVMVWRKLEFSSPRSLNGTLFQFHAEKNLSLLNCAAKTAANKEEVFYDVNGNVIAAYSIPHHLLYFSNIVPDSVSGIEYNVVCKIPFPKSPGSHRHIL